MENGPFIDGLPIKNGGSFHGHISHNQMVDPENDRFIKWKLIFQALSGRVYVSGCQWTFPWNHIRKSTVS
jgi:hypothetical protein